MKIAIVGSRDFPALHLVRECVKALPNDTTIISGGARGVDAEAAEAGRERGLKVIEHLPELDDLEDACRGKYARRYYTRNQKIVNNAEMLIAFTDRDAGGTWDTIKKAKKKGIIIKLINSRGEVEEIAPQLSLFQGESWNITHHIKSGIAKKLKEIGA